MHDIDNMTLEFQNMKRFMDSNDGFNILFLGPTGTGKSHLINHLFNQKVAVSTPAVTSVTREMYFYEGNLKRNGTSPSKVNIIDTIGKKIFQYSIIFNLYIDDNKHTHSM